MPFAPAAGVERLPGESARLRLLRSAAAPLSAGAPPAAQVAAALGCGWLRFWTASAPGHCPAPASPSAQCQGPWLRPLLEAPARSDMDDEEGPSPNAYNITTEIIDTVERKAPSYSFGVTHSPTKFISEAHEAVKFGQVRAPPPLCLSCTLSRPLRAGFAGSQRVRRSETDAGPCVHVRCGRSDGARQIYLGQPHEGELRRPLAGPGSHGLLASEQPRRRPIPAVWDGQTRGAAH